MIGRTEGGSLVLLDDADRAGERETLERWRREYCVEFEVSPSCKPFAAVTMPAVPVARGVDEELPISRSDEKVGNGL
jgi:hypothetical protein